MLQNEATTLWERFELKNSGAVYSHNHPMYGAVGYWFYAYLAGIKLVKPGAAEVDIHPYFPKDLLSANALLETAKGDIVVRWVKRFGKTILHVTIPMGVKANIYFAGQRHTVGNGFWMYEVDGDVVGDSAPC
jgi:alpha-L-rhamnosidase